MAQACAVLSIPIGQTVLSPVTECHHAASFLLTACAEAAVPAADSLSHDRDSAEAPGSRISRIAEKVKADIIAGWSAIGSPAAGDSARYRRASARMRQERTAA